MKATRALAFLALISCTGIAAAFPYSIDDLVNGADMAGMKVTVTYADTSTDTATWTATGAVSGAATGSGWSLAESGDTLNQPGLGSAWTLFNTPTNTKNITGFEIDAWVAKVMFDVMMDLTSPLDDVGTPGSSQGRPFTDDGNFVIQSIWDKYANPTNLQTAESTNDVVYANLLSAPDLYGTLKVSIGGNGLAPGQSLQFLIDTDKVPEPPLFGLMALGLAGLAWQRRRRKPAMVAPV